MSLQRDEEAVLRSDHDPVTAPGPVMEATYTYEFLKSIGLGCLAIEPLFSIFLRITTYNAIVQGYQDFVNNKPLTGPTDTTFKLLSYFMASCNLIIDWQSISFASDAEGTYLSSKKKENISHAALKHYLALGLMLTSIPLSFIQGALADNIPLADMIFDHIPSKAGAWAVNISAAALIAFLGSSYYYFFNRKRAENHINEAVDLTVNQKMRFLRDLYNNPMEYLEVFSEAASNIVFRGVNFGWLVAQEFQHVLRLGPAVYNSVPVSILGWATAFQTGVLTAFTRTLSARDEFLNREHKLLRDEEVSNASAFKWNADGLLKELLPDLVIALIRGVGTGMLVGLPFRNISLGYGLGYPLGITAAAASYYVRYKLNKKNHALETLKADRKGAEFAERDNALKDLEKRQSNGELQPLLSVANGSSNTVPQSRYRRAEGLFEEIGNLIIIHFVFVWLSVIANFIARLARFVSFYPFAKEFLAPLNLSNAQYAAVTLLAGGAVTVNDSKNFANGYKETQRNFAVSWKCLTHEKEHNPARTYAGMFSQVAPVRFVRALWKASPGSHNMETLEAVRDEIVRERQKPALPQPAAAERSADPVNDLAINRLL